MLTESLSIATAEQARVAAVRISSLRKRALAFASFDDIDEAEASTASADALEQQLQAWKTEDARQRGAAAMDELRTIVAESQERQERYRAGLVELVKLDAEMRREFARFHALRAIAYLAGETVDEVGPPPKEPFGLLPDRQLHADPDIIIRLAWNDPTALREVEERRGTPRAIAQSIWG